ncbi:MAG TPA: phenylacetic acid degradation operon negative regulatory protein PaaX [Nevskiaceae bacterium]
MTESGTGIADWIKVHLTAARPRTNSLIITIFGDSLRPRCERIWLGELIALLRPFGINERHVRTSVYRLSRAGWLVSQRQGRRSYYGLAPRGWHRFERAYERVYTQSRRWDGEWTIALLVQNESTSGGRAELRRELEWEGFASPGSGVFIRPNDESRVAWSAARRLGLESSIVVLHGQLGDGHPAAAIDRLVSQYWNLGPTESDYRWFEDCFRPLEALLATARTTDPEQAFVAQTLLIDAFRRATLRDPQLPPALLPAAWPGPAAHALCRHLYRRLYRATHAHLAGVLEGGVREVPDAVTARFGGLQTPATRGSKARPRATAFPS